MQRTPAFWHHKIVDRVHPHPCVRQRRIITMVVDHHNKPNFTASYIRMNDSNRLNLIVFLENVTHFPYPSALCLLITVQ